VLADLLQSPGVTETSQLRGRLGFMAYHGGALEKVTDIVASEAAKRSGASYYGVIQTLDPMTHIASTRVSPADSPALAAFLDHVDVVISMHGYGREDKRRTLLLGGQNRELASFVAKRLRRGIGAYEVEDDLSRIPTELAGQHPANPVNLPRDQGVQIELPPVIRWHFTGWHWSDFGDHGRAPDTERLIVSLADAASEWMLSDSGEQHEQ